MGAVLEGFEAARKRHDELLEEGRQREKLIDDQLHALGRLLDDDAALMKSHNITHEFGNRMMRVSHKRSPIMTIHFDPIEKQFQLTIMKDGSHSLSPSLEECARGIGAYVFDMHVVEQK